MGRSRRTAARHGRRDGAPRGRAPRTLLPRRPRAFNRQPWTGAAMPTAESARVHPSALVAPEADLAEDVVVGPHVVIEGAVRVGPGCVLRPGVHLVGPLTLGRHNTLFSHVVLGEQPQ